MRELKQEEIEAVSGGWVAAVVAAAVVVGLLLYSKDAH